MFYSLYWNNKNTNKDCNLILILQFISCKKKLGNSENGKEIQFS